MAANHSFSIEELKKLNAVFSAADSNKDGVLNKEEFQRLIENTIGAGGIDIAFLFGVFDKNADGKVTFDELVTALAVFGKGTVTQKLEFLFDFYDKNRDGVLTSDEIRTLVNHVKKGLDDLGEGKINQTQLEAEAIVKKLDGNGDGKISRAEWVTFGNSDPNLLEVFGLNI